MSASKKAKQAGLSSATQVAAMTKLHPDTIANWSKKKPELFEIVLLGCVAMQDKEKDDDRF